ncbi:MAG: glutathione peroxidase [Tissierellia bacterium]|nr:glutathione peroxidase [Tissierellia bacterium]
MDLLSLQAMDIKGEVKSLSDYRGQVLLIVNVASECGYTHQYEGLRRLHERFHDDGFEILAFPSNQFGGQEPGSNEEIYDFAVENFGVRFPLFAKTQVVGEEIHPIFKALRDYDGDDIRWNFEKYLLDRDGAVVGHYLSKVDPRDLVDDIDELI